MQHFKLFLLLTLLASAPVLCEGQDKNVRYQGTAGLDATFIGLGVVTSHGALINQKDFVGMGVGAGAWSLILVAKEWYPFFADYRHDFVVGPKARLYLQANAGGSVMRDWTIGDEMKDEESVSAPEKGPYQLAPFLAAGGGIRWNHIGVGLQCGCFPTSQDMKWVPTLRIQCYW